MSALLTDLQANGLLDQMALPLTTKSGQRRNPDDLAPIKGGWVCAVAAA